MQEVNWRWASCLHNPPHFSSALSAFLAVMCPIPLCLACPPSLFLLPVRGVAGLISFLHVVLWQIPREDWTFPGCSQWTCFWALSWKLCERHPPASCCSRGLLTWLHQSFSLWGTQRTVSYHSFVIAFHIWKILPSLPFSFVLVSPCFFYLWPVPAHLCVLVYPVLELGPYELKHFHFPHLSFSCPSHALLFPLEWRIPLSFPFGKCYHAWVLGDTSENVFQMLKLGGVSQKIRKQNIMFLFKGVECLRLLSFAEDKVMKSSACSQGLLPTHTRVICSNSILCRGLWEVWEWNRLFLISFISSGHLDLVYSQDAWQDKVEP